MSKDITLPNLGENIESGDVLTILVSEGDEVQVDDDLMEIETDKATLPVPSPDAGRITKIHVSEGDTVPIGGVIVSLETAAASRPSESESSPEPEAAAASEPEKSQQEQEAPVDQGEPEQRAEGDTAAPEAPAPAEPASSPQATKTVEPPPGRETPASAENVPGDGRASSAASPAVRRLARELGVDLRLVRPSGEGGRITREDVQAHVRQANERSGSTAKIAGAPTPPGEIAVDDYGPVRREKMSRLRQTIARNMLQSYSTIPQLTNFDDADITELERLRQESKAEYAERGVKLTTMPFLIKAVSSALKLHPVLNASVDIEANQVIYKEYVNIGIAVDTDRGLLVPVLPDADRMTISHIAEQLGEMAQKMRDGKYGLEDLRGGTFTISNLGAIGGAYSTPIINPPEVAILLPGRARRQPVYLGDQLTPRLMMPLSITYDHRVVDGAAAARFLNEVKSLLSNPGRLLLAP